MCDFFFSNTLYIQQKPPQLVDKVDRNIDFHDNADYIISHDVMEKGIAKLKLNKSDGDKRSLVQFSD